MELHFTGRNIEVTPALKSFTTEKFKSFEKRTHNITHIYIAFHVENLTHIAEATVHLSGTEIHASAKDADMYKAIGLLADKLLAQITKQKEKLTDHHG
jgi:putative sigma-54 modulation protein